ncbi:MAG: DEDD exonuclease domain-containing protein [Actinomycetota bacterium]
MRAMQQSFDDLGAHLSETTFVVLDLETTGGQPEAYSITEIGAVKVRGGELLGEYSTLVDPGTGIPPFITVLTGITDSMVIGAPRIEEALPSFLEFLSDGVIVAHNAAFDTRFLSYESERLGYGRLQNEVVCTVRLAKRLVRDEVPNLRLATLARALRAREPCHRALADARACADVLHSLLELAGRWGVKHLQDLLWFQSAGGHPQARKRALADALPRTRGVYLFRDPQNKLLYVGKATDLRSRVRSYFSDDRKQMNRMLRELSTVDYIPTRLEIESSVLEARLIRKHRPAFNRAQRGQVSEHWVRLTEERFPRLSIVRTPSETSIGPLPSRAAHALREAFETAAPIRRCNDRIGAHTRFDPCVLAQIGRCSAPCDGRIEPSEYLDSLAPITDAFQGDPSAALDAMHERMLQLSIETRFEEAAETRDRAFALASALHRGMAVDAMRSVSRLLVESHGFAIEIRDGALQSVAGRGLPVQPDLHSDESKMLWRWLHKDRSVRLLCVEGELALPAKGGMTIDEWMIKQSVARR